MKITEGTKISLGILTALIGGVVWLSKMSFQQDANAQEIEHLSQRQENIDNMLYDLKDRMIRIEILVKKRNN